MASTIVTKARELAKTARETGSYTDEQVQAVIEAVNKSADDDECVAYRDKAKDIWASDDCEIDDDAIVSVSDRGAFVQAWVWVPDED